MRKATVVNIGDRFGRLLVSGDVLYKTNSNGTRSKYIECVCECGEVRVVRLGSLTSPTKPTLSCGCLQKESTRNQLVILVEGEKFGRLTVVKSLGMLPDGEERTTNFAVVKCECGSPEFTVRVNALQQGNTKSCGCLQKEIVSNNTKTHGMSRTSAYYSWQGLKDRCTNPKNCRWDRYGRRGISYTPKWESFEGFWLEMSEGWFEGADIDRIDFDGNYCKENCRWVNRDVGNHNKSKPDDCTSIFKGVYYEKARDKWVARLNRNSIVYLQKRFETEVEAAFAYDNVSEEIYGDRPNKTNREASQNIQVF